MPGLISWTKPSPLGKHEENEEKASMVFCRVAGVQSWGAKQMLASPCCLPPHRLPSVQHQPAQLDMVALIVRERERTPGDRLVLPPNPVSDGNTKTQGGAGQNLLL
jgi:hypothetical protein